MNDTGKDFPIRDVLTLLIRAAGFRSGLWTLSTGLSINASVVGTPDGRAGPGLQMLITSLGVTPAAADTPAAMVVDAATVWGEPGELVPPVASRPLNRHERRAAEARGDGERSV